MIKRVLLATVALCVIAGPTAATAETDYSQPARNEVPRRVFWGDTHLHTRVSVDAYSTGNRTLSPEQAYRFARGEAMTAQNGMKMKLRQPLDFLVVSDHAEYLGMLAHTEDKDDLVISSWLGKQLRKLFDEGDIEGAIKMAFGHFVGAVGAGRGKNVEPEVRSSIWDGVGERADRFNTPGRFTAFVGYEYTSQPAGSNLHRVVVFRDGRDKTSQVLPFTALDSLNPENLWKFLAAYEEKTGGQAFAIPHNANLSDGRMFEETQYNGDPMTASYAQMRVRWEPLHEMTQIKGDSETHPLLSPTDEYADYETWNSWAGGLSLQPGTDKAKWQAGLAGSYARSTLKRGLEIEQKLGVNPYKLGFIGSSDTHTGLAATDEDNFSGKFGTGNPSAKRWSQVWGLPQEEDAPVQMHTYPVSWTTAAAGLAAVWAKENTREALFDSMRRKEVYATTGPRMTVRFFGGWDYAADADKRRDYVDIGYEGGVPMGGDLTRAVSGKKPRFLVLAAKDPDGANLDRVQVIKGWVDAKGKSHEKVYDVAWSGNRKKDAKGKVPAIGSTVDTKTATYTNTIGAPILSTVWTDPDFDAGQRAFYYVRVIEIPTPRWTDYDAAFYRETMPDFVPLVTQERAYTSPIWYTP